MISPIQPAPGFTGIDFFEYAVSDGNGGLSTDYVEVSVSPTSTAPLNLVGTGGTDVLEGNSGNDLIQGLDGNDILRSGGAPLDGPGGFSGEDELDGGAGDDTLISTGGIAILTGGAGSDTIIGTGTGNFWDWAQANYQTPGLITGIEVNFTGEAQTVGGTLLQPNEISDGQGGIDTVTGMHVLLDSEFDDVIEVDIGFYENSFSVFNNFLEVRLTTGDDIVNFTNVTGFARVSYQTAGGGVSIDMDPDANFRHTNYSLQLTLAILWALSLERMSLPAQTERENRRS